MINNINDIIKNYISQTEYSIENSLGNCSFFAKDFINWAKNNGIKADYVYMPMSKEYRSKNKIGKDFGGNDSDWEDHIVPMINGVIIDFTYTPRGVSKNVRTSNTIPPELFKYSKSLFEPNGVYGKLGYTEPEINTEYGNSKNINSFDVQEPNKKKSESLDEAKKTDYSKEKSQGLHGWFARKGGGGSSGWVDCNTCRKNPKTGRKKCKPCGRQDGEKRKYPACRPTPASCGTRGKGKKWGKKSTNENENFENKVIVYPDFQGVDYEDNITGDNKILKVSDCFGNEPNKGLNYFNTEKKDYVEKIIKSAKEKGIESFPPIIALEHPLMNGKYLVIDGNHRLGAFKIGGIPEIKAEIIKLEDIVLAVPNTKWVEGEMPETITVKDAIDNKIDLKKYFNTEDLKEENMKNLITQKLHEMVEEGRGEFQNYMFFNNLKTIKDAIDEILQMDANAVDQLLSDGHNWATDHLATSADDIDEVYHFLSATLGEHEPDSYDGETEGGYEDEYGSVDNVPMNEAEYKGRKVQLGKPTRGDVKKYKVFVKNAKGKVVKVNFGDKNMEIKRDNPKRRKSFRARHKCAQAKDRTSPKYWSCRMWSKKPVSKIVGENFGFDENSRIFVKNENMTQPTTKPTPLTKPSVNPNKPFVEPVQPSRKNKPFLPDVAPGIKTDPKAKV